MSVEAQQMCFESVGTKNVDRYTNQQFELVSQRKKLTQTTVSNQFGTIRVREHVRFENTKKIPVYYQTFACQSCAPFPVGMSVKTYKIVLDALQRNKQQQYCLFV